MDAGKNKFMTSCFGVVWHMIWRHVSRGLSHIHLRGIGHSLQFRDIRETSRRTNGTLFPKSGLCLWLSSERTEERENSIIL